MVVGNHTLPTQILTSCNDGLFSCFAQWTLLVTNGTFWIFALLSFCIILIMANAHLGWKRAFGYSSFVGLIGSVWLGTMGLINWPIASVFILTGIIGIVIMIMSEN